MKLIQILSLAFKHFGTIKKVSDTLSILVEHSEQIFPKVENVWADEIAKSKEKEVEKKEKLN